MAIYTFDQVLNRLAEKTYDNTKQLRRGVLQRRNGMEDLYGIEFHHNGANTATFYVSVSPDLVYYERFAFKFVIEPFESSVTGASGGGVSSIGETELSDKSAVLSGTSTLADDVTPNPHTHSAVNNDVSVNYGIKQIATTSDDWHVRIDGIDITEYLIEQHDGDWIDMSDADGARVFPTDEIDEEEGDMRVHFYDILDVACMMQAEGRYDDRKKLLMPGLKKVEIESNAPFSVTALLYIKLSHLNR